MARMLPSLIENLAVLSWWRASAAMAKGPGENLMSQAVPAVEQKLPLSTAILSNLALVLLMWNLALRLALLLGGWKAL